MPANDIPCKYDASHGTFRTPVKLSQHYVAEHADVWTVRARNLRRYRCELCGHIFRNPSSHIQQAHPEHTHDRPYVGRWVTRVEDGPDAGGSRAGQQVDVLTRHAVRHTRPTPVDHGPWEVDDVVLPVVKQLAAPSGLIPVDHLAAILAWRDATAVMLSAVTRS